MSQAKLRTVNVRLIESAEMLYTTTYVGAWACVRNGQRIGKIIAELAVEEAEGRDDGMSAGDLGILVYDIHHKKVEVDVVDEPVCLALADALFGTLPRFPRWLNPKFLAMLESGAKWMDDLPNQTFSAELIARMESERD